MGYYIGKIIEFKGEYEFTTTIRFAVETDPDQYLHDLAKSWRLEEGEWDETMQGYDHGDGIYVTDGNVYEISFQTYNELTGIITAL